MEQAADEARKNPVFCLTGTAPKSRAEPEPPQENLPCTCLQENSREKSQKDREKTLCGSQGTLREESTQKANCT